MLANQFTEAFREEHRQMRDMLLGLMAAVEANDVESVRRGIEEVAAHAGPHFHYEEQVLYPALAEIYGDEYVEKLGAEHDAALEAVQELAELAEAEEITPEQARYGLELVRRLLPHVSDRDGLAMIVEVLPEETVQEIVRGREKSKRSGKTLLELAKGNKKGRPIARRARGKARKAAAPAKSKPVARKVKVTAKPARRKR
jgi:hemerythrin